MALRCFIYGLGSLAAVAITVAGSGLGIFLAMHITLQPPAPARPGLMNCGPPVHILVPIVDAVLVTIGRGLTFTFFTLCGLMLGISGFVLLPHAMLRRREPVDFETFE